MLRFLKKGKDDNTSKNQQQSSGIFSKLKNKLGKTRQNIGHGVGQLFSRNKKIDDAFYDELEMQLLIADVGVEVTEAVLAELKLHVKKHKLHDTSELVDTLKTSLGNLLETCDQPLTIPEQEEPYVILMVGVNGAGKTTTIGKLAKQLQAQGKSVMLAAGDTFRAAAVEQLQTWGQRNEIPVIAQATGADSASVVFDAVSAAKARNIDVLIADTAGRLHTQSGLMAELEKVTRVMKKLDESAPHETMLVLDASIGQNALQQAEQFNKAVSVTGLTMTKLDGTAKGGILFAIANKLHLPIRFIGVGEGIEDLRSFDANEFIEAIFDKDEETDEQAVE